MESKKKKKKTEIAGKTRNSKTPSRTKTHE
jgi:hypothetical protein